VETRTSPNSADGGSEEPIAPTEAMRDAFSKLGEVAGHAREYVSARIDLAKVKARNIVLFAVLGVVALFAVAASMIIGLAMLYTGLAQAIAAALGGRMWAGNLIVGGGMLALFAGGGLLGIARLKKAWLKATIARYEARSSEVGRKV